MKKIVLKATLMLFVIVMIAGCSKNEEKITTIDIYAVASEAMEAAQFRDKLEELDETILVNIYSSIHIDDIEKYKVYVNSTSAKAEELALFEAKDEDKAQKILQSVNERIEDLKFGFEGYLPEELKYIENAVVKSSGKYVMFGVGQNYEKINQVFEKYIK